jgi:hypothetical protein
MSIPLGRSRDAQHFLKRSLTSTNLEKPVFIERAKPCGPGELFHRALVLTSSADRLTDASIDYKELG